MGGAFICLGCGKEKARSPKASKKQAYCGEAKCQRHRKAIWQKQMLQSDSDYRSNQKLADQLWRQHRPAYWREYRMKNETKMERNRQLQRVRNRHRRHPKPNPQESPGCLPLIAKMDAVNTANVLQFPGVGEYWLIPPIAKMDAVKVKIVRVSVG